MIDIDVNSLEEFTNKFLDDEYKTARQLFREAGYLLESAFDDEEVYKNELGHVICFDLDKKTVNASEKLFKDEIIAIDKRMNELGWL